MKFTTIIHLMIVNKGISLSAKRRMEKNRRKGQRQTINKNTCKKEKKEFKIYFPKILKKLFFIESKNCLPLPSTPSLVPSRSRQMFST